MKHRKKASNIKISFHGHIVILKDENDRQTTPDGVEIWIQLKPANSIRPMAEIPARDLDIYKHCRPYIISLDWSQ